MATSCLVPLLMVAVITSSATEEAFTCPGTGFFSKPGSLHEYYVCLPGGDVMPRTCPGSGIFDPASKECQPPTQLTYDVVTEESLGEGDNPVVEEEHRGTLTAAPGVTQEPSLVIGNKTDAGIVTGYQAAVTGKSTSDVGAEQAVVRDNPVEITAVKNVEATLNLHKEHWGSSIVAPEVTQDPLLVSSHETDAGIISGDQAAVTDDGEDQPVVPDNPVEITAERNVEATLNPREHSLVIHTAGQQTAVPDDATPRTTEEQLTLCEHVDKIGSYVSLVVGSPMLRKFRDQEQYNGIVDEYNRDMKQAENNTHRWRRGESIVMAFKRVHMKSREYQYEFQRKFDVYKEQIQTQSTKRNPQDIQNIEQEIIRLRNESRSTEEALNSTGVTALRQYFETRLESTRKEIERLMKEINTSPGEILLKKLTSFLSIVLNDADEVEDLAMQVLNETGHFLQNVRNDTHVYKKLDENNKRALAVVTAQFGRVEKILENVNKNQTQLTNRKNKLDAKQNNLYNEKLNVENQLRAVRDKINETETAFEEQRIKPCSPRKRFEADRECEEELKKHNITLNTEEETARIKQLEEERDMIEENQNKTYKERKSIKNKLIKLSDKVSSLKEKKEKIWYEHYNIQINKDHLLELQRKVSVAEHSIERVKNLMEELHQHFDTIVQELQIMTDQANMPSKPEDQERIDIERKVKILKTRVQKLQFENINYCH